MIFLCLIFFYSSVHVVHAGAVARRSDATHRSGQTLHGCALSQATHTEAARGIYLYFCIFFVFFLIIILYFCKSQNAYLLLFFNVVCFIFFYYYKIDFYFYIITLFIYFFIYDIIKILTFIFSRTISSSPPTARFRPR